MRYCLVMVLMLFAAAAIRGAETGLRLPAGFDVSEYAGSDLANDITCLTLDPQGNVVVSGRGYIRRLLDTNNDGKADRAETIVNLRDAAHGLLWEGDTLYYIADGGLHRLRLSAKTPELIFKVKTGGEHDAHALRRGPDGWLYLLCGNNTGIDGKFVNSPRSPIHNPVAGAVVRFSPDFSLREIVADGFRNPYGFDFSPAGDLFTYDSDNERCVSLPWYEFTRCYHVIAGGHYGWQSPQHAAFWRQPPYFADVVAPVCTLQRGSPTGVAWQGHPAVPRKHHGLYLLDWTFGRIWQVQPQSFGATFHAKPLLFLEAIGSNGFAPTAITVQPKTGDLFVSVGGRGTRGSVYRIHFWGASEEQESGKQRPLRRLEWKPEYKGTILRELSPGTDRRLVLRALIDLRRFHDQFTTEEISAVIGKWWNDTDGLTRAALSRLIEILPADRQDELAKNARSARERLVAGFGIAPAKALALALDELQRGRNSQPEETLALVRLIQVAVGDIGERKRIGHVWEGYSLRKLPPEHRNVEVRAALRRLFPHGHADLSREIARTLAMLEDDDADLRQRVLAQWSKRSEPVDDLHCLIVYSRLRGSRSSAETATVARALLALDAKLDARQANRERNWSLRVAELHKELAKKDPALNAALLADSEFGRPEHVVFARCAGFDRHAAVRQFVERSRAQPDLTWSVEMAGLLKELPDVEAAPLARELIGRGGLDEALVPILARSPQQQDVERFLAGATSPSLEIVRQSVAALRQLKVAREPAVCVALVRGLQQLPTGKEAEPVRAALAALLQEVSGQKLDADPQRWVEWVRRTWPEAGKQLAAIDGVDLDRWKERLAKIDWSAGSIERGRAVFARGSCAACHTGGQALGPDLAGVARRFSRDDLFTAIVQPNRDVPLRYRATQIETNDGRTLQGLIIYEALDGVILQTTASETVRIDGRKIESKRSVPLSLMPAGLLDKFEDRELADLYSYLSALGPAK